jgi:hypothetical protein
MKPLSFRLLSKLLKFSVFRIVSSLRKAHKLQMDETKVYIQMFVHEKNEISGQFSAVQKQEFCDL